MLQQYFWELSLLLYGIMVASMHGKDLLQVGVRILIIHNRFFLFVLTYHNVFMLISDLDFSTLFFFYHLWKYTGAM